MLADKLTLGGQPTAKKIRHSDEVRDVGAAMFPSASVSWKNLGKHECRKVLVADNFLDIAEAYTLLQDNSMISRYIGYSFSKADAERIVKNSLMTIVGWSNKNYKTDFELKL